ncbi:Hemin transport system permease protein HmuU [Aquimixticola soesokkakensis]|uniref:Hemin transport system permease protein HmuU n=1 Tax=Aquimixticola soesokkakensis TaxID=1519096 RepID=A0A1Y5TCK6_9RHOB|nr:iron chelate uptake ABC transporter family permease subunit [Aquimixticola soesokkakensis]SLN60888.1 Hemin transport system permease protein HmuU [Aquimixticola soesokkakensis]
MPADRRLAALAVTLLALAGAFLMWQFASPTWALIRGDEAGPAAFILSLRGVKLAALVAVGLAIGTATILFQTVSENRILTPGILGFDALFIFVQTLLVFTMGGFGLASIGAGAQFLIDTSVMVVAACALFSVLLGAKSGPRDLSRMLLTGVIIGVLLRSLSGLMGRMIDPSEFAIVQGKMFATFGAVDRGNLILASLLIAPALLASLALARRLDVMGLGRQTALGLGLDHDRWVLVVLALVAVLTASATALVGPVTFLGLLAASLARSLLGTHRHALLIPATALIAAIILVAGQFVFERLLGQESSLAVIIEFVGGLVFLALVLKGKSA